MPLSVSSYTGYLFLKIVAYRYVFDVITSVMPALIWLHIFLSQGTSLSIQEQKVIGLDVSIP